MLPHTGFAHGCTGSLIGVQLWATTVLGVVSAAGMLLVQVLMLLAPAGTMLSFTSNGRATATHIAAGSPSTHSSSSEDSNGSQTTAGMHSAA